MEKIRVSIVGLGKLGLYHAENIHRRIQNAELTAICHYKRDKAEALQKDWGIPYAYADYDEMLGNKDLDAIVIASPANLHCEHAVKACKAGLHVFCEKPLGMNPEECLIIEKAADENKGKQFMVGFMRRFDPSYTEAMEKIKAGEIGRPLFFRGYSLDPVSNAGTIAQKTDKNGSWFMEMTVHDIDLARWFLGSEAACVYAAGGAYMFKEFEKNNDIDNGFALMKMQNGTCAFFYSGKTAPHGCHVETEIVGENGIIRINPVPGRNRIQLYNPYGVMHECLSGFLERWGEAYLLEMQHFVNCIAEGKKPEITALDGRIATQTASLIQMSYEKNQLLFYNL